MYFFGKYIPFFNEKSKNTNFNSTFLKNIVNVAHLCDWEICGAATQDKLYFFKNLSATPKETFYIAPSDYFKIYKNIIFLFHSHCLGSAAPSEADLKIAQESSLGSLIYSVPEKNFSFYDPKREKLIYFCL